MWKEEEELGETDWERETWVDKGKDRLLWSQKGEREKTKIISLPPLCDQHLKSFQRLHVIHSK